MWLLAFATLLPSRRRRDPRHLPLCTISMSPVAVPPSTRHIFWQYHEARRDGGSSGGGGQCAHAAAQLAAWRPAAGKTCMNSHFTTSRDAAMWYRALWADGRLICLKISLCGGRILIIHLRITAALGMSMPLSTRACGIYHCTHEHLLIISCAH